MTQSSVTVFHPRLSISASHVGLSVPIIGFLVLAMGFRLSDADRTVSAEALEVSRLVTGVALSNEWRLGRGFREADLSDEGKNTKCAR